MYKMTLREMEEKIAEIDRKIRALGGDYSYETNKKRWSFNSHRNACLKRVEVLTRELRMEQKQEHIKWAEQHPKWRAEHPAEEPYNPPITITSAPLDVPLPAAVLANVHVATVAPQDTPAEDLDALIAGLVP